MRSPNDFDDAREPGLKQPRLFDVAAVADAFDPTANLPIEMAEKKHRLARGDDRLEKGNDTAIGFGQLPRLGDHIGVNQIHAEEGSVASTRSEIRVQAHVGQGRQDLRKGPSMRTRERGLQNFAMFRFRAAAMRPGALLHARTISPTHSAHQEIGMFAAPAPMISMISSEEADGKIEWAFAPGRARAKRARF